MYSSVSSFHNTKLKAIPFWCLQGRWHLSCSYRFKISWKDGDPNQRSWFDFTTNVLRSSTPPPQGLRARMDWMSWWWGDALVDGANWQFLGTQMHRWVFYAPSVLWSLRFAKVLYLSCCYSASGICENPPIICDVFVLNLGCVIRQKSELDLQVFILQILQI